MTQERWRYIELTTRIAGNGFDCSANNDGGYMDAKNGEDQTIRLENQNKPGAVRSVKTTYFTRNFFGRRIVRVTAHFEQFIDGEWLLIPCIKREIEIS